MSEIQSPVTLGVMKLLTEKLKYLQASSFEISKNIAAADIPGMHRRELKPFEKTLRKTKGQVESDLNKAEVQTTEMINRESETLSLSHVTMEYQSLIHIYKRYHDLVRLVIGKG